MLLTGAIGLEAAPKKAPPLAIVSASSRAPLVWKTGQGLRVKVSKVAKKKFKLKGFRYFMATVTNKTKKPVSINARLSFRGGKACLLYAAVPAGETVQLPITCKLRRPFRRWSLIIKNVWRFIL